MTNTQLESFMTQVDKVIQQNLSNELFSIQELSRSLFLSESQIYRKIKRKTGLSPSVYIRNIRLDYAKKYVQISELRMSEITDRVGFNSLSYFSRCFSKRYGCSPSQLRSVAS